MRLIDASALCEALMTRWSIADKNAEKTIQEVMTYVVTPIVVSQPTIDAVSVVRCAECHWARPRTLKGETGYRCVFYRTYKAENGYCDCGERE